MDLPFTKIYFVFVLFLFFAFAILLQYSGFLKQFELKHHVLNDTLKDPTLDATDFQPLIILLGMNLVGP